MIFSPQLLTVLVLAVLGIASLIPFIAGLLGFSRRISYAWAAAVMCAFIVLEAESFSPKFKFPETYGFLQSEAATIVIAAAVLLFMFVLAHWLGDRLRAGFIRTRGPSR